MSKLYEKGHKDLIRLDSNDISPLADPPKLFGFLVDGVTKEFLPRTKIRSSNVICYVHWTSWITPTEVMCP